MKGKLLVVDDDHQSLESTKKILEFAGYQVEVAHDGAEALEKVREASLTQAPFDGVLSDVRMPKMSGLDFLKAVSAVDSKLPVVLMTAFGQVEDAVWAMKRGAVDFLTKPFKRQVLLDSIANVLVRKNAALKNENSHFQLPGVSLAIQALRNQIQVVAPTHASVLLSGESGSGKERVARLIHQLSGRVQDRFIAINCAAMPENLIESELFGHEKGAFSGATQAKAGLFEMADGGTLLLDEIGDMPLGLQAKLLRTLQEGEVRRVGATQSKKIDVRVIASSHRDLSALSASGHFRTDLLYRLEVIHLRVPALRERSEDILPLAKEFLKEAAERHSKEVLQFSAAVEQALLRYAWPGNIRELSNVIERAVVFANSQFIEIDELPSHIFSPGKFVHAPAQDQNTIAIPLGTSLKDVEEMLIRKTLEVTDGDKNMTAKLLGINSRTICRKLEKNPSPKNS